MDATYQVSRFLAEADFFLLHHLCLVEIGHDTLGVHVVVGVGLPHAVRFEGFLDAAIARGDGVAAFLDDAVLGLNFFEQVGNFGGEIGN